MSEKATDFNGEHFNSSLLHSPLLNLWLLIITA